MKSTKIEFTHETVDTAPSRILVTRRTKWAKLRDLIDALPSVGMKAPGPWEAVTFASADIAKMAQQAAQQYMAMKRHSLHQSIRLDARIDPENPMVVWLRRTQLVKKVAKKV